MRSKRYMLKIAARKTRALLLEAVRIWEANNFFTALEIARSYKSPQKETENE